MKISTNMIGNYTPQKINSTSVIANKTAYAGAAEKVTADEKQFFTSLYPENKEEIMNHHFYNQKGKMSGVALGSLFDRKG